MIVIVNIGKSLKAGVSPMTATERAWPLSVKRCQTCTYVVAVDKGLPVECFRRISAFPDLIDPGRVAFKLALCTPAEQTIVRAAIRGISLKGIQRGKYIP